MYKFATVLPPDYEMDSTHTLGMAARRDLTEFELDRYVDNQLEHFIPSGMGTPMPREIVTTETCNGRCHDPLAMHGGSRQAIGYCILCHNPWQEIDPDTGNSVDMPLMTHKIHMGENLVNGYNIIGYRQSNHDYSEVIYPAEINDCEMCHTGGTPTKELPLLATPNPVLLCEGTRGGSTAITWGEGLDPFQIYYTSPEGVRKLFATRSGGTAGSVDIAGWAREGAEFELVDTATGDSIQEITVNTTVLGCAGNAPGTARGLPGEQHTNWMTNPTRKNCGSCHDYIDWDTGEGHSANNWPQDDDSLCALCHFPDSGGEYDMSVNAAHQVWWKSTQMPGVLVELVDIMDTDPGDTPTVTFTVTDKFGRLNPNDLNRLRFVLTGPNADFDFYVDETVDDNAAWVADGVWAYTFETPLPMDAMGSYTVSVEGRNNAVIDIGGGQTISERDAIENPMLAFAVTDDTAKPRRVIVDDAKCESCHNNVSLHGDNRKNAQYCVTCHNPTLVDIQDPAESVNQKWMIHKIHRGAELENGYVVVRSRGTYDFSHVEYTGDLRNCDKCHVNDSQQLPLSEGQLPQVTPNFYWDPIGPATSACLSCHDGEDATSHALANTTFVGESCSTCHGEGKAASVDKVHAR
jgi:hypothetical protein